jgi:hypothetical protein
MRYRGMVWLLGLAAVCLAVGAPAATAQGG